MGLNPRTDDVKVDGPDGIAYARTNKRRVEEEAFDKSRLLAVSARPWDKATLKYTNPQMEPTASVVKEYDQEFQTTAPGLTTKVERTLDMPRFASPTPWSARQREQSGWRRKQRR